MIEYSARITSQEPVTAELLQALHETEVSAAEGVRLTRGLTRDLRTVKDNAIANSNYTIDLINETQHQLCDLQVLSMSDGGVIEVKRQLSCVLYKHVDSDGPPRVTAQPKPKYTKQQIRLTLRSDHNALKRQVDTLKAQLAQLEATTKITPVTNSHTRKQGSTLYPRYGDWLLTSDIAEQYISFSGLPVEVGRSIYIQTRKRAYLYSSGHSFYGLPGKSTQGNRWLSNNTTYRFVRASDTSWLVTASSSPYPWT